MKIPSQLIWKNGNIYPGKLRVTNDETLSLHSTNAVVLTCYHKTQVCSLQYSRISTREISKVRHENYRTRCQSETQIKLPEGRKWKPREKREARSRRETVDKYLQGICNLHFSSRNVNDCEIISVMDDENVKKFCSENGSHSHVDSVWFCLLSLIIIIIFFFIPVFLYGIRFLLFCHSFAIVFRYSEQNRQLLPHTLNPKEKELYTQN